MDPARPNPAATVVLARDHAQGASIELFLVKRHDRSGFMAGAHVFPGGRVDDSDLLADPVRYCDGLDEVARRFPELPLQVVVGFYVAAIRELYEEAGILLARNDGGFVSFSDPEVRLRFEGFRTAIHQGLLPLPLVLESEGLRCALDALHPYAHWITPEVEGRRFDTWFFVAGAPDDQTPLHDNQETVESEWVRPADALARYRAGDIQLAPPTLKSCEDLAEFPSLRRLLQVAPSRKIIPIMPCLHQGEEGVMLLFPGDPLYPEPMEAGLTGSTRMVLEQGRWWSRTP